jgi:hypothetical protein
MSLGAAACRSARSTPARSSRSAPPPSAMERPRSEGTAGARYRRAALCIRRSARPGRFWRDGLEISRFSAGALGLTPRQLPLQAQASSRSRAATAVAAGEAWGFARPQAHHPIVPLVRGSTAASGPATRAAPPCSAEKGLSAS